MDINAIEQFHEYEPIYDDDPRELLEQILSRATYLTSDHLDLIRKAYEIAQQAHLGVTRHSGEPYIVHPVRVLEFLLLLQPDVNSLQAALLHDVIEDTPLTEADIAAQCGEDVAQLCEGLVKVSTVKFRGEERQLETLKKTFLSMGRDLRVIFIKLADRIHNIQTLKYHPKKEKRERIANETLKIYVPIAKRLGLYVFQGYLENGAFRALDPKEYKRIYTYVTKQYGDVDMYKSAGVERLKYLCEQEGVSYIDIRGRLKSPYRIHTKLKKYQTSDISKVFDVLAYRVVTDTISNCYNMLGIIHKHYAPIFAKMKDYIALPKPNGYTSLHTTILGMFDFPVEIQVRTPEMDAIAEYGVAAHFAYAEKGTQTSVSQKQAAWIEKLQDIVQKFQDTDDKEGFKHQLNVEILDKNIFVYTPKGDIIELPQASSVLDFAFRVHTDIGLRFKNAFVNGRIVPLDYTLKTGDIISINTFKTKITATKGREKYLRTPTARTKLTRYMRQMDKENMLSPIRESVNEKLRELGLPLYGAKGDMLTKHISDQERDQYLWQVYDKQLSVSKLLRKVYAKEVDVHMQSMQTNRTLQKLQHTQRTTTESQEYSTGGNNSEAIGGIHERSVTDSGSHTARILVDQTDGLSSVLCQLCHPTIDDKILAKSEYEHMKIHTVSCSALQNIKSNKLYEAHWTGQEIPVYTLKLFLKLKNKPGVMVKILQLFDEYDMPIAHLSTGGSKKTQHTTKTNKTKKGKNRKDDRSELEIHLPIARFSKIDFFLDELHTRSSVVKIVRLEYM